MAYTITDIEGIGPAYAAKLEACGITTTEQLLEKCCAKGGRKAIEEESGLAGALILKWTNHADLMRISGVAGEYAELLEAAGVDTVKELRNRNAANLAAKMLEVNEEKSLTRRVPSEKVVTGWVAQAKDLDPMITH